MQCRCSLQSVKTLFVNISIVGKISLNKISDYAVNRNIVCLKYAFRIGKVDFIEVSSFQGTRSEGSRSEGSTVYKHTVIE